MGDLRDRSLAPLDALEGMRSLALESQQVGLEDMELPCSLEHLTLPSVRNFNLPRNLQTLTFGDRFNEVGVDLPDTLQKLTFGEDFNQSLRYTGVCHRTWWSWRLVATSIKVWNMSSCPRSSRFIIRESIQSKLGWCVLSAWPFDLDIWRLIWSKTGGSWFSRCSWTLDIGKGFRSSYRGCPLAKPTEGINIWGELERMFECQSLAGWSSVFNLWKPLLEFKRPVTQRPS